MINNKMKLSLKGLKRKKTRKSLFRTSLLLMIHKSKKVYSNPDQKLGIAFIEIGEPIV